MDILISSAQTGLYIAALILASIFFTICLWRTGSYLSRPLGVLVTRYLLPPLTSNANEDAERRQQRAYEEKVVSGFIALFLYITTIVAELALNEQRVVAGEQARGTLLGSSGAVVLLLKACLEATVALAVLAGVVRLLKLT